MPGRGRSGPRIFLSYRRDDASYAAGRLADRLRARFGAGNVFVDVGSILPGQDFRVVIAQAVRECDVLLALIGPQWLDTPGKGGGRRIDEGDDLMRVEIASALELGLAVMPVLLDRAVAPTRDQLPEDVAGLADRQAEWIRYQTFDTDAARIEASLAPGSNSRRRGVLVGLAVVLVVLAVVVGVVVAVRSPDLPGTQAAPSTSVPVVATGAAPVVCPFVADGAGVVAPVVTVAGRESGLTFCPVRINGGTVPVTGPFELAGQVVGDAGARAKVLLWNQDKAGTCDAYGNPPPVLNAKFVISAANVGSADGAWSYTDGLGYAEAVTYGRQFEFVTATPDAVKAILGDREAWGKRPGNKAADYPGILPETIPPHTVLATFEVPRGPFLGAKPCRA